MAAVAVAGCGGGGGEAAPEPSPGSGAMLMLSSPAFADGDPIPSEYSCGGANVWPPLEWSGVPEDAEELVLTVEDPDAPGETYTHWTVFGIEPSSTGVESGELPAGWGQGRNDAGTSSYAGPCPPEGPPHRYVFTLSALPAPSGLETGAPPDEVHAAVESATEQVTLTGLFGR